MEEAIGPSVESGIKGIETDVEMSSAGDSSSRIPLQSGIDGVADAAAEPQASGSAVAPVMLAPPIGHPTPQDDGHLRHTDMADAIHGGDDTSAGQGSPVAGVNIPSGSRVQEGIVADGAPEQQPRSGSRQERYQPHEPPKRSSSLAVRDPAGLEEGELVQAVSRPDRIPRSNGDSNAQALLNLPPPLPFNLKVDNLWVGVPARSKALSWLPSIGKKRKVEDAEQGVQRKKWILKGVECECQSGEVLAILGGSGSGKTTLLNAIAHRLSGLPIEDGEVAYYAADANTHLASEGFSNQEHVADGIQAKALGKREIKKRIGFVRQQDFLVECLTVRETLTYAARLRLPPSLPDETVSLIVEQTIDELGLRDAADTVVGGPLRKGISGGEKRRLSIGCVLVTLPSVLILDEPTSGLDAFTSYLLLLTLSQLARRGRTIVLSIHAPRSDAFDIFDRIALLSKGQIVYSGLRRDCLAWFADLGHHVEKGVNPLDFLIDVSTVDNRDAEKEDISLARVKTLVDAWKARDPDNVPRGGAKLSIDGSTVDEELNGSELDTQSRAAAVPSGLAHERSPQNASGGAQPRLSDTESPALLAAKDERRPGFLRQTAVLTVRAHKNVYRNVPQLIGFLLQGSLLGFVIGLTYWQLPEDPTGIQSLKNLSFQLIPGVFYLLQVFWIYKYCSDLVIFDREREDNLYDVIPAILSDWLSFLMPSVMSPFIYVVLVYFISHLWINDTAGRLFTMIASTVLVQFCTQGLALIAASLTRNFAAASVVGNFLNLMQIMSSGFILTHVPPYVAWIKWISPYFYSFQIVAVTQFKNREFDCPPQSNANLAQCEGNNVLNGLFINYDVNIGAWFGGLIGLWIAQYALACFILWVFPVPGMKHAAEIDSQNRGKSTDVTDSHMVRDRIDVELRNVTLAWERRGRGLLKNKKRFILNDVSARFPAGEISTILGPSGAGKSTLLQLLAGRRLQTSPLSGFYRTGDILFNGQPDSSASRSNVAFVEQDDDWHLPSLTVRETLRYAAILRLPSKMPRRQKVARAETVLLMLGLKDCADLPVGGAQLKGISGGEKRRLSLAVQMINDPAVLVVDEPTSGLDASIALSVMQVLKDIAATGRTVIATIHQPRSDIWQLADNVTLLAKGGIVTFSGKRADAVEHFASIGHPMPSEFFNPADHLLDLVSVDPRSAQHDTSVERVRGLATSWHAAEKSTQRQQAGPAGSDAEKRGAQGALSGGGNGVLSRGEGTTSMIIALPVVIERHWKNLWRNKEVFFNRLVQTPLLGGLFILFFQRLDRGPSGAQTRIGITIENTTAIPFVGLLNAMAIFPADRNLYFHESRSSARYSPATFVITYTLVEFGFELLGAFGYAAIMNVAVGLQTSARIYFEFAFTIWAMINMGESFAIVVGSWIAVEGLTVTVVSTLLSMAGQISGVISLSVPEWLSAIAWAFPMKASSRVQIINEATGLQFDCTPQQIQDGVCVAQSGAQLLALFGWQDLDTARYMGILVATAIAWRLIAWVSLAMRVGGFR